MFIDKSPLFRHTNLSATPNKRRTEQIRSSDFMTFDPFSILPDIPDKSGSPAPACAPAPAVQALPAIIPQSLTNRGNNGRNLPSAGEGLEGFLEARRVGRASLFTQEAAATIIEGAEDGKTMKELATTLGINRSTIWSWIQLVPGFADEVARAREYQGHAAADDAIDLLDNVSLASIDAKQNMAELRKAEQRARIRMQLAECFNFNQYGKKKQSMNVNLNATISPVDLSRFT
jgi:hypothetical protein